MIQAHRSWGGPQKGKWRGLRALYSFKFGGERVETRTLSCWCAACVHNTRAGPGADADDLYPCRFGHGLPWEMARHSVPGSGAAAAGGGGSGSGSESDGSGWVGSEGEEDEPALAPAPERDGSNYVATCCGCLLKRAVATPWPHDEDFYCGYLQGCKCGEPSMEAV